MTDRHYPLLIEQDMLMANSSDLITRGEVIFALLSAFGTFPNEIQHRLNEHEYLALLNVLELPKKG